MDIKELNLEQLQDLKSEVINRIVELSPECKLEVLMLHENDWRLYRDGEFVLEDKTEYISDYYGYENMAYDWAETHTSSVNFIVVEYDVESTDFNFTNEERNAFYDKTYDEVYTLITTHSKGD